MVWSYCRVAMPGPVHNIPWTEICCRNIVLKISALQSKYIVRNVTFPDCVPRPLPLVWLYFHVNISLGCEFHEVQTPASHLSLDPCGLFSMPQFHCSIACPWHDLERRATSSSITIGPFGKQTDQPEWSKVWLTHNTIRSFTDSVEFFKFRD